MTSYFDGLVGFVGAHPQLSFLAIFLLVLSEAVPVIGTAVPGSTLILAISALATTVHPRAHFPLKKAPQGRGRRKHRVFGTYRPARVSQYAGVP
jgi:hypothetical protein